MTSFGIFALFGLPASLVALGWGAVFLHGRAAAREAIAGSHAIRTKTAH